MGFQTIDNIDLGVVSGSILTAHPQKRLLVGVWSNLWQHCCHLLSLGWYFGDLRTFSIVYFCCWTATMKCTTFLFAVCTLYLRSLILSINLSVMMRYVQRNLTTQAFSLVLRLVWLWRCMLIIVTTCMPLPHPLAFEWVPVLQNRLAIPPKITRLHSRVLFAPCLHDSFALFRLASICCCDICGPWSNRKTCHTHIVVVTYQQYGSRTVRWNRWNVIPQHLSGGMTMYHVLQSADLPSRPITLSIQVEDRRPQ